MAARDRREGEAREAGELAKINIPYRAIASDNVDDRPELARQKASFSNGGEPMTIRGILEAGKCVCVCVCMFVHTPISIHRYDSTGQVTPTNYRGRINRYVN